MVPRVDHLTGGKGRTIILEGLPPKTARTKHLAESFSSESGILRCKWNRVCRLDCGTWPTVAHGQWSAWEVEQSSTWRELRAVGQVLQSLVDKLAGERIRWFTDNKNIASI